MIVSTGSPRMRVAVWILMAGLTLWPGPAMSASPPALDEIRARLAADAPEQAEPLAFAELERLRDAAAASGANVTALLELIVEIQDAGRHRLDARTVDLAAAVQELQEHRLGATADVARGLYHLAKMQFHAGDFAAARASFERSQRYYERWPRLHTHEHVEMLTWYSWLLLYLGDYAPGEALAKRGLLMLEAAGGDGDPALRADLLSNLGAFAVRRDALDEGLRHYLESLAIFERLPDQAMNVANLQANLGRFFLEAGDPETAIPYLEASLEALEEMLGATHAGVGLVLRNLGWAYDEVGRAEHAAPLFRRALANHRRAYGTGNPQVAFTLGAWAGFLARNGQVEEAMAAAIESEEIRRRHVRTTISDFSVRGALSYAAVRPAPGLDVAVAIASRAPASTLARQGFDALIRARSLAFEELAARARRDGGKKSSSSPFLAAGAEGEIGYAAVQSALPASSALVAVTLRPDPLAPRRGGQVDSQRRYFAFVLRPGHEAPGVVVLGSEPEIGERVRLWHDQLSRHSVRRYRKAGERLRESIWDPLLPSLAGAETVFFVADGALSLVSLAALPVAEDSYLLESGRLLHYLSAERDVVVLGDPSPPIRGGGLLAVGGVEYGAVPAASARSASDCGRLAAFEPLVETAQEARAVADLYRQGGGAAGSAELLLGARATAAAFKRLAPAASVIHIATHGFFVACPEATAQPRYEKNDDPLERSGFALASANRGASGDGEDGILSSREIARLDLSGVRWAVLSACDTGVGDLVVGEGVVGARQAFRLAGVPSLVMSLWQVDDVSTRRFMTRLYRARFVDGLGAAEAVRVASREVLQALRREGTSSHPYYWGGFMSEGAWQ